ncbi:MAG: hypothetical protein LBQ09_11600 [Acidobacteriaceae bacterium]|jgi:hypothetical protein|nr:hypothetical protein [Acidobacteriaceae bacterium]
MITALNASPSRIPVLLGGCGTGRSTALYQLRDQLGRTTQYIDVDRAATTPERFLHAVVTGSPFAAGETPAKGARPAFDAALVFFSHARLASTEPATFLLDEFLELRTFESFPGLRRVIYDLLDELSISDNRFVLTSRYTARTLRLLRDRSARFEVVHIPLLTAEDIRELLGLPPNPIADGSAADASYTARAVQALTDGRPVYVRAMAEQLDAMRAHGPGGGDVISAMAALFALDGALTRQIRFSYELRLHRARGYGALKAILDILADQEGLTLTEISQRLQRTPGSTKDYLSWLEDVDLVSSRQKRYSYTDPLMRMWVRLHCRATAATDEDVAREVQLFAINRLPSQVETPAPAAGATAGTPGVEDDRKPWDIIELD